ncbi:NusA-like transcription termination signal-binding factor [Natrialba asiatica]|uniref:Probable transcription termination protein NusA n=1 Tax=Natrialba asiatica (strain ATCC 700177 / DSM 12278 / JCM 9576 / FERM P-10747 / NBRC 102637 / 172P1) TaxID=29540 RepID=M0AKH0_NATA1|nr:NusA-like transcription termination signal-binding factor [Natrialba asiatica]ELY98422.1 transcription elongation factor NusA-like protein [Natrialba asiatica DSM 12278]
MAVTLDDDARQYLETFEEVTGADGIDCIIDTEAGGARVQLTIVVASGQLGEAIGPDGRTVTQFQERIGLPVRLVENADDPEAFVANAFAPAAVYNVTISENNDTVAYVEVADSDRGVAIGSNGRTIETVRRLADRHCGIDDVQLI